MKLRDNRDIGASSISYYMIFIQMCLKAGSHSRDQSGIRVSQRKTQRKQQCSLV
jgi:hypothetical protein